MTSSPAARPGRARAATLAAVVLTASVLLGSPAAAAGGEGALGGSEISGSTDRAAPTEVELGTYQDSLSGEDRHDTLYYRYHRADPDADSTIVAGVATAADPQAYGQLDIEVLDADGNNCDDASTTRYTAGLQPAGVRAFAGRSSFLDRQSRCLTSDFVDIVVSANEVDGDVGFTLRVLEENTFVADTEKDEKALPQPDSSLGKTPRVDVETGGPEESGSLSLTDAPELPEGSFTTNVTAGSYGIWKVPVTWGQQLDVGALVAADPAFEDSWDTYVRISVLDPALEEIEPPTVDGLENEQPGVADEEVRLGSTTGPVRLLNRFSDSGPSLTGDYYLVVSVSQPSSGETPAVPVSVAAEVTGEEEGVPTFARDVPYVDGSDAGAPEAQAADGDGPGRALAAGGLALVGVVAIGGGLLSLRRR